MSGARYPIDMVQGLPVVQAPEEIDAGNADLLRAALLKLLTQGHTTVVVDMTRTQFCDSVGLHVLVRAHQRAWMRDGELRLVLPDAADALRVFMVTGLDRVIPRFADPAAAVARAPATGSAVASRALARDR
jgi:anti-sigma B factor antagonist